ncbi:MAG: hypothetical protein WD845_09110 [Pirellulales bacterium]
MSASAAEARRPHWQFGLRGLLLLTLGIAMVLAVASLKLRQDARFEAALQSLASLGMQHGVGSDGLRLECHRPQLADDEVEQLIERLQTLGQPHDLGLSPGLVVERIDLTRTKVTPAALARLREALPTTQIEQ